MESRIVLLVLALLIIPMVFPMWMHAHGIASMIATNFCDWDMAKVERMLTDCRCAFAGEYEA